MNSTRMELYYTSLLFSWLSLYLLHKMFDGWYFAIMAPKACLAIFPYGTQYQMAIYPT